MGVVAIVPARGGSKRIPGKNIRPFEGKPILAYALSAALESGLFSEVMVSTDSEAIAEVARAHGAVVPFMRSAATSDDHATTSAVIHEVLDRYEAAGQPFAEACCIYPCNPFLRPERLRQARDLLHARGFDSVFAAVRYSYPPQRAFVVEDGRMVLLEPRHIDTRSQDLRPIFHDAGQFYWFRVASLRAHGRIWTDNSGVIELPEAEVQDIDTEADWALAELKYRQQVARRG